MRKRLLTLSLAQPRQKLEAIFKALNYGDTRHNICSFCRNVLKWRHPSLGCELRSGIIFPVINSIFLFHVMYRKIHRLNYTSDYTYTYPLFILCIEFHVALTQTNFVRNCPHDIKGWTGMFVHSTCALVRCMVLWFLIHFEDEGCSHEYQSDGNCWYLRNSRSPHTKRTADALIRWLDHVGEIGEYPYPKCTLWMLPKIAFLVLLMLIHERAHVQTPAAILASLNSQVRLKTAGSSLCEIHGCV